MLSDTIIAPATPPGYGGVSLVRISGPISEEIAKSLAKKTKPFKDRVATLSSIYNLQDEKIDDAIITYFKTPSSYTGENVIEISCHGNPIIVDQIITSVCKMGARIAEPGEFTKRAFLNGKLDLVQAESVAAIIKSQSTKAARINHKILSGDLSNKLREIKDSILNVLAKLEFEFDISENELTQ
ncbi:tRNA uridine-5-carboxymethylaminomethyl(34) synthesis GTPase MnmE, partial [bacterium]|nr:tRNA uridine-5-carboxymethylaminomethyl(34) synthesis GTPase MnmE [bacterium]